MRMLLEFNLPSSRAALLGLRPDLRRVVAQADTLAYLHNQGWLDAESRDTACDIARAFRNHVGATQETLADHLAIGQRLALMRLKQAVRDLAHATCWPLGATTGTHRLVLSQSAALALGRLRLYDPVQGVASYGGNMAGDIVALADGLTVTGEKA